MEVKAFPGTPTFDQDANRTVWQEGMDLRDYFAARIAQSIVLDPDSIGLSPLNIAKLSYNQADAMMEARNGN